MGMHYLKTKLGESVGEDHTIAIVGWCAVAIAVVLLAFTKLPDLFGDFIDAIFDKLQDGLGL